MDGALATTAAQGLISGLVHPVIGRDHLAFVIAAGLVNGIAGLGFWLPLLFVAASIGGVLLHLTEMDIPLVELAIAISVLLIGAFLASGREMKTAAIAACSFIGVGLLHGYAYGEAIVGAEPTPLYAYLFGLTLIQSAI